MSTNHSNESSHSQSDRDGRVRLRVLGISYSQIQSGAYALILAQANGPYRIPVVVGQAEAQSIAIRMEGIIPPRPMTHDLFASLAQAYGLELKDVFIHRFEDGIFSSELTFEDRHGIEVVLDARTSDAIAIAMRTNTPICTTPEILEQTGFIMEIKEADATHDSGSDIDGVFATSSAGETPQEKDDGDPLDRRSLSELRNLLNRLIADEEYEEAAKVKAAISRRENKE